MSVRVMVVDDHPLIIEGVRAILEDDDAFTVVAVASGRGEAAKVAAKRAPDVVLVDLQLGEESGLDLIDDLKRVSPHSRVVVLSVRDDAHSVREAVRRGACGYVLKGASRSLLRSAVSRVASGFSLFDPDVTDHLLDRALPRPFERPPTAELTEREREVLRLVAAGMTNEAIAEALELKVETVKTHLSKAYARLDASDRANAVAIAIRAGLL
jgi:DNA-binding NarL/FixJ family response regulator